MPTPPGSDEKVFHLVGPSLGPDKRDFPLEKPAGQIAGVNEWSHKVKPEGKKNTSKLSIIVAKKWAYFDMIINSET